MLMIFSPISQLPSSGAKRIFLLWVKCFLLCTNATFSSCHCQSLGNLHSWNKLLIFLQFFQLEFWSRKGHLTFHCSSISRNISSPYPTTAASQMDGWERADNPHRLNIHSFIIMIMRSLFVWLSRARTNRVSAPKWPDRSSSSSIRDMAPISSPSHDPTFPRKIPWCKRENCPPPLSSLPRSWHANATMWCKGGGPIEGKNNN